MRGASDYVANASSTTEVIFNVCADAATPRACANTTGADGCGSCDAGKHASIDGATSYSECIIGKFSQAGAEDCTDCDAGTYSSSAGAATCTGCGAGKYSDSTGAISAATCTDCDAGKYSASAGATSDATCTACDAGRKASGTNSTSCDDCAPGRYASGTHAKVCADCEGGSYSASSGATSCAICVSPTTTAGVGAENCSACIQDYYWDPRITKEKRDKELELKGLGGCTKCPNGVDCGSSIHTNHTLDALHVKKNWYRASSTATTVYKCAGENCQGGKSAVGEQCRWRWWFDRTNGRSHQGGCRLPAIGNRSAQWR